MEPFASVEQYREKYPDDAVGDAVLREHLMDATDLICSELESSGVSYADPTETFARRLMRVCRDVVHRAVGGSSGDAASDVPFGATQHTWTEDVYTSSVRYANPYGDLFLTEQERRSLVVGESVACVVSPYG